MQDEEKTKEQLINELAELRQTKVLFEGLFEFAPDAIVVVNREGSIMQINNLTSPSELFSTIFTAVTQFAI